MEIIPRAKLYVFPAVMGGERRGNEARLTFFQSTRPRLLRMFMVTDSVLLSPKWVSFHTLTVSELHS